MQGAHSYPFANPFPNLRLRVNIRAQRQCVLRLVGQDGVVEDLAKKVDVREVEEGAGLPA